MRKPDSEDVAIVAMMLGFGVMAMALAAMVLLPIWAIVHFISKWW